MAIIRALPGTIRPASSGPPRDVAVDLVRVLGVLAVVAGHTWTEGPVRDSVFPWHVPVFFVLTGLLWRPRPWYREIRARSASLLRPYLLWLVVAAVAVAALVGAGLAEPVAPVALVWGGVALGGPLTSFWFVTALFAAAVLYAAVDRLGPPARAAAAGVALVLVAAGAEWLAPLPLAVGVAVPALVFVEAGRQLHRLLHRPGDPLGHPLALASAVAVVAAFAVLVLAGVGPRVDLKTGEFGGVPGVLTAVGMSAALLVLARPLAARLGRRAGSTVTAVAAALVPVVLLHPVLLAVPAAGGDVQRYLTAVAVPLVLALLLARSRLSGWGLGR